MSIPIGVGTVFIYNARKFLISGRVKKEEGMFRIKDLEFDVEEVWSLNDILKRWADESLILSPSLKGEAKENEDLLHISDEEMKRVQFKLNCIKPLIDIPAHKLSSAVLQRIDDLNKEGVSVSRTSLYTWRKLYIDSHCDVASLLTRYGNVGNQGTKRLPERVREIIRDSIDMLLLNSSSRTGTSITNVCKHVRVQIRKENNFRVENNSEPFKEPSHMTIYREFQAMSELVKAEKRFGKVYAKTKHGFLGKREKLNRPLQLVEIDHSPLDIILVDDETRIPLPRGYLTVVIDVYSRYVLGYNITFKSPNYESVMLTLLHAISKKNIKKLFPDIDFHNEYLSYGIPEVLVMDRGKEFRSKWLKTALMQLGCIEPDFNIAKSPWQKPHVESFFRTKNTTFDQSLPGTTFSNNQEAKKRDHNPQKNAVIGIEAYKKMFSKWLMDDYHIHVMVGIGGTPMDVFQQGIKLHPPRIKNMAEVKMALFPFVTRIIDRGVISTWNLKYRSMDLYDLEEHVESSGSKRRVMAKYDPDDISHIYVWDERINQYLKVPCDDLEYTTGLSLAIHKLIHNKKLIEGAKSVQEMRDETTYRLWEMAEEEKLKGKKISKVVAVNSGYGSNESKNQIKQQKDKIEDRKFCHIDEEDEDLYEMGEGFYG